MLWRPQESGLDWTGPATGTERGTNKPIREDFSTSHKNKSFRSPKHLPILPDKMALSCPYPLPVSLTGLS